MIRNPAYINTAVNVRPICLRGSEVFDMDTVDYVIVGAGSAGSVLANRLSEDEGVTVCVVEDVPLDTIP